MPAERPGEGGRGEGLSLRLLGVGAMNSPRYAPAGLLVQHGTGDVMLDGGPGSAPRTQIRAWLVTDLRSELASGLRRLARERGLEPSVATYRADGLVLTPLPVVHTSHPTWGYRLEYAGRTAVWAPEFCELPGWAAHADLVFADAAAWSRPIRFRGGVGGHAAALDTADRAREAGVRRLVFAHIGRPTVHATDAGDRPPFGEMGVEGAVYRL